MANHTCPSRPVENNNVKLTHNWGQPPRKPPEYEHMQSALKRRKALSFLTNQHISKFSNISTRVNAKRKIKHLKTQDDFLIWGQIVNATHMAIAFSILDDVSKKIIKSTEKILVHFKN
jgi:hypothetical protein